MGVSRPRATQNTAATIPLPTLGPPQHLHVHTCVCVRVCVCVCVCACTTYILYNLLYWLCLPLLLHSPTAHVHTVDVHDLTFTPEGGGVGGLFEKVGKPVTTVQDRVSTFINRAPLHIFEETSGDFPVMFAMTKPGILATFVVTNGCF